MEPTRHPAISVASILFLFIGVSFTVGGPFLLAYMLYSRSDPVIFGLGVLDGESRIGQWLGFDGAIALGFGLVGVTAMEVLTGYWLWKSLRRGGALAMALLPADLFFGFGFGIPALLVLPPVRIALVALAWKTLHQARPRRPRPPGG